MWTDTWTYTPFYPIYSPVAYYTPAVYVVPHYRHHWWRW